MGKLDMVAEFHIQICISHFKDSNVQSNTTNICKLSEWTTQKASDPIAKNGMTSWRTY